MLRSTGSFTFASRTQPHLVVRALLAIMAVVGLEPMARLVSAVSPDLVISQVYGGGSNSGAPFTHDFIELFNRGTTAVSLIGMSLQYASATGTGNFGANSTQLTELPAVTLAPGQRFLVQEAGGTTGAALPTPDLVDATAINMSATAGKVTLVRGTESLGCNGGSAPCDAAALARIVDLVGYGNANFFEGAPVPTMSNTTAAMRVSNGCADTDNNLLDFAVVAPSPGNTASPLGPCVAGDAAPTVTATTPADGAMAVPVGGTITIDFSESVNVAAGAITVSCPAGTPVASTAAANGVASVLIDPAGDLPSSTQCVIDITPIGITDTDLVDPPNTLIGATSFTFTTEGPVCGLPFTSISSIQGSGPAAAITGTVTTQGVVVGDYEGPSPELRGFYIQDQAGDGNADTSDGIFVFNGNNDSVSLGDLVRVTGTASEFQDQTQISTQVSGGSVVSCGTGAVAPTDVLLPLSSATAAERFEGMLVRLPQTLSVTEHFQLGRFGQVVVSSGGRLKQPTEVTTPGAAANAMQAANDLNRLIVDDDLQSQNSDPIAFGRMGHPLSATNTLRGGDTATATVGVMTYTWAGNAASGNAYRVRPIGALDGFVRFDVANPRPSGAPPLSGSLRVASMNLLNFFNTFDGLPDTVDNCSFGLGGAAADCRGADTQAEFDRQWPKTVAAILGSAADIIGVIEIENDGYGPNSALRFLVDRLNAATAPDTYAFIDADAETGQVNALGTDAIKVGLVYKPGSVVPVGRTAALNSVAFVNGGDSGPRNRPALAQAFEEFATGARLIVAVNHFKSKGSECDAPDAGDGQGNCNVVRTAAASLLRDWLATNPTGLGDPDVLVLGDLNSYSLEDPVRTLESAGYANLVQTPESYSYVFDGQWGSLDHALGSPTLVPQVTGARVWPISADEPSVIDYNTDFKSDCQIGPPRPCADPVAHPTLYAGDEFRIADHTPVLVDLELTPDVPVSAHARAFGHLLLVSSAGVKAGDPGSRMTFEVHARIRVRGTQPQGGVTILFRRTEADGPHYYLVWAPSVATLTTSASAQQATVTARAIILDISTSWLPRIVDLNASIRVSMDDNGEPGVLSDTLGVTVLNRQGALWFSSRWNGSKTIEQPIESGNVHVR